METKKRSLTHICAYLSLAISITMLVLWCCNVGGFTVVNLDSFVGVIVALLAIVVTLVLGWQIYNSIELKTKIEELNMLKENLNRHEKEFEKQNNRYSHLIYASLAEIEINNKDYKLAFSYLMISLKHSMSLDSPVNIETLLKRMDFSVTRIEKGTSYKNTKIIQENNNSIRKSQLYNLIRYRYEKIYNDFIFKVKITDDEQ